MFSCSGFVILFRIDSVVCCYTTHLPYEHLTSVYRCDHSYTLIGCGCMWHGQRFEGAYYLPYNHYKRVIYCDATHVNYGQI